MKRVYVGGILTEKEARVLLVDRAPTDPWMAGLWSLPGGRVEAGESLEEALAREFYEETGLEVEVRERIIAIERPDWRVEVFLVRRLGGSLSEGTDPHISEARFFGVYQLPERIVLEAQMALVKHALHVGMTVTPNDFTVLVDSAFSSLFYTYLAPQFAQLRSIDGFELLEYIVVTTPHRKFKSCIPYLLADCHEDARPYCAMAEVLFAIWTLLDDLCDRRVTRYGRPTTLRSFSLQSSIVTVFTVLRSLEQYLEKNVGPAYSERILSSLVVCGEAELERFENRDLESVEHYLEQASKRTLFLRTAWAEGLRLVGKEKQARFLFSLHETTSKLGQIINDYFDLRDLTLRDFTDEVVSYYSIVLRRALSANPSDLQTFLDLWSAPRTEHTRERYQRLLRKYDVQEMLRQEVLRISDDVIDRVRNSGIDGHHKEIVIGWLRLSFRDFVGEDDLQDDYSRQLEAFLGAFSSSCRSVR